MKKHCSFTIVLSLLLFVAACSEPQSTGNSQNDAMTPTETMTSTEAMTTTNVMTENMTATENMTNSEAMTSTEVMTGSPIMTGSESMSDTQAIMEPANLPAWQTLPLTNARTGEQVTLADLTGKTVFVETMATWCTNCRQQLNNVQTARTQLGNDEIVFVAVSVETNVSNEALATYADDAGFDWFFAVSTPEMLVELAAAFGQTITNPPATPHFIIRPDGSSSELITGIDTPEQLIQRLQEAQG